jgi:predicted nucleotidyltransferase
MANGDEAGTTKFAHRLQRAVHRCVSRSEQTMDIDERVRAEATSHPYPLLFMTISGAHLYGFPSPDSDYDLRGSHLLPLREVVGLDPGRETVEISEMRGGLEIDLVTHDVKKYFELLLKKSGDILEQIFSPLIVQTTPEHEAFKAIARQCLTRHHSHHYFGFAQTKWTLFEQERPYRVKPLLYVYRVLLTGMYLMRAGEVEANLVRLNAIYRLPYIDDLVARKLAGPELAILEDADLPFHQREYERLRADLEDAFRASRLPEAPAGKDALNDLLVQLRLSW